MATGFIDWPSFIEFGKDLCFVVVAALILSLALRGVGGKKDKKSKW